MKNFRVLLSFLILTGLLVVSCSKESNEEMEATINESAQLATPADGSIAADLAKVEAELLNFNQTAAYKEFTKQETATSRNANQLPARVESTISREYPNALILGHEEYVSIPNTSYRHYSVYLDNGMEIVVFQWGHLLANATIEEEYEPLELKAGELDWDVLLRLYYNYTNAGKIIEEVESSATPDLFKVDFKDATRIMINDRGQIISTGNDDDGDDDNGVSNSGNHIDPATLPASVRNYIATNYPSATIIEAEQYSNRYEVELNNGIELYFDLNGNLIGSSDNNSSSDDDDDGLGDNDDGVPNNQDDDDDGDGDNDDGIGSNSDDDDDGDGDNDDGIGNNNDNDDDSSGNSNHIDPATLPASIRNYIATNYPSATIVEAEQYSNRYEVELNNGIELYFDLDGNLINTSGGSSDDDDDGNSSSDDDDDGSSSSSDDDDDGASGSGNHIDPANLPTTIKNYIAANYPNATITEAEKYTNRYEVELNNGVELYFDLNGNLTGSSGGSSDDDDDGSSSSDDDDDGSSSSSDDDDDGASGSGNHIDPANLPTTIKNYIAANYPNATITEAEKYTNRYEVELNNGVELYFDLNGNLTGSSGGSSDDDDDGSSSSDDDDDGSSSSDDDDDSSSSDDDDDSGSSDDDDDSGSSDDDDDSSSSDDDDN